ncbi:MAG: DMT family transporter [Isosphaeraceae bacterium]
MTDPTTRPLDSTALAGAFLCCALWGGNSVAVKYAVPDLPAFGCAAIRFLLSLPVIALACWKVGQPLTVPRPLWGLLIVNALLAVVQIGSFNWGTSHSLAGRSSVFINVYPLVVAPLAWLILGEWMGKKGILGILSAASGVVLLLSASFWISPGSRDDGSLVGDLVVLGSGVLFGVQTIVQKKTFPLIPPATLLFSQSVLAIPVFLAYSGLFEGYDTYQGTPQAIWGVLYQGLLVSGGCFTGWMLLLRRYPAGRLATLAFVTPLFGVLLGNLTRGEPLTWQLLGGGALVGVGIYLVATDRK